MPYNGSGLYSAPATTASPAAGNTTIDAAAQNTLIADLAAALTTCITKDGQTTITSNLPMSTLRHTGVGDALALTDYASANQVVDGALVYGGTSAAGADDYVATLAISPVTYVAGNRYSFIADVANAGACTANFNSIGAKSIKLPDGNDPYNSDILANMMVDVEYDGTNLILLNPFRESTSIGTVQANKAVTADSNGNIDYGSTTTISGADVNTIDVTGLTFLANKEIKVDAHIIQDATGGASPALVLNGDVVATNYYKSYTNDGSAAVKANNPFFGLNWAGNTENFIQMTVSPNSTSGETHIIIKASSWNGTAMLVTISTIVWTGGAAITSIGIRDSGSVAMIAAGSRITVKQI